jgi:hypothetical protein
MTWFKGYRTLALAVAVTAVGAIQGMDFYVLLPDDPKTVGWITTGLGIAMAILRKMTTTAIGEK